MTTSTLRIPATLLLCVGLVFGAAAQVPVQQQDSQPAQDRSATHPASDGAKTIVPEEQDRQPRDKGIADDRLCLRETGSRLSRTDRNGRQCVNASGRSYSREDLERAGMGGDLAAALRMLDATVR